MSKIAVILSGCGRFDGSETKEAVLTLLAIDKLGAAYQCFAPDALQHHVVNHATGDVEEGATRNMLIEAARIPHEPVLDAATLNPDAFDALILPGGFGAAKNLCDFAINQAVSKIHPDVERTVIAMRDAQKPTGFICIAPIMIPHLYPNGVKMTLGNDVSLAKTVTDLGAVHQECTADACVSDATHKVASTPAYMVAENISDAATGIEKLVQQMIQWAT